METIAENLRLTVPLFLGAWLLFLILSVRRPQRLRNSFVLMIALFFTVFFIAGLFGDLMAYALLGAFLLCILVLLLVPAMLVINGITMLKKEGRSLANILSLLLGLFVGFGEIALMFGLVFSVSFSEDDSLAVILTFCGITVFYFSLWMLCFVLYMISIQVIPHRMKFDYVIIHGCGLLGGHRVSKLLANRLDAAIRIYHKCKKKPILIPSGGRGSDEALSEADAMEGYLLEHGIPREHILPEANSATTMENLVNSKALIESRGSHGRVALVSSNYHVYRCLLFAKQLNFRCIGIGAKVAWYYWPSAVIREFAAVFTKMPHVFWMVGGYILFVFLPFLPFVLKAIFG